MEDNSYYKQMWLVTNYSCNNRCDFCYTEDKGFPNKKLSLEDQKEIIDSMAELGAEKCSMIGGEPTLHPNLANVIGYGNEKGIKMKVVTNGRKYSDKNYLQSLKDAGMAFTAISLHGSTPEEHEKNTKNKRSYYETIKGIKNCIDLNIPFATLTTLNKKNIENIIETARILHELGVEGIVFNIAAPTEGESKNENIIPPNEIAKIIENSYRALKSEGIKVHFYATVPLCLFDEEMLNNMIAESYLIPLSGESISECNIYDGSGIAFDPNGQILSCTHRINSPVAAIMDDQGKLKTREKVRDILIKIRETIGPEKWTYPSQYCHDCTKRMLCIGGCPLFWMDFNPEDYISEKYVEDI